MRIACLQLAPELGKPTENILRANTLLEATSPQDLDLLVLPELAFSGHFPIHLPPAPHTNHVQATTTPPSSPSSLTSNPPPPASAPAGPAPPPQHTNA